MKLTRRAKYGNRKVTFEGQTFDSKKEFARWVMLSLMERDGLIRDLTRPKAMPLTVNGKVVCRYTPDFSYFDTSSGRVEYEDVKSEATRKNRAYRIKYKLFEAIYGQTIRET